MADRTEGGQFGDRDDWLAAEARWADQGIASEDLLSVTDEFWPYDRTVRERGFPYCYGPTFVNLTRGRAQHVLERLFGLREKLPASKTRSMLATWILELYREWERFWMRAPGVKDLLPLPSPQTLKALILEQERAIFHMYSLDALSWPEELSDEWTDFLDWLGRSDQSLGVRDSKFGRGFAAFLARSFTMNPDRLGLLRLLRCCAWGGLELSVPSELLDEKRFQKPVDRINASYVRLTASDLTESDADGLTETIADESDDNFNAQSEGVLGMLASRKAVGPAVERFTLSMLCKISPEDFGARQTGYRLLRGWLAKRRSRLGEVEEQRALGLEFLANLREKG